MRFSALKSDTDISASLRSAIYDYTAGIEDRFGGSALTTVLAVIKAQENRPHLFATEVAFAILTDQDSSFFCEDALFLALSRVVQELNLQDWRIAEEAERLFTSEAFQSRPKAIAQLVEVFIASGGDLTPKMLEGLHTLRSAEAKQWAAFAIENAYVGDVCALASALSSLLADKDADWAWDYFIDFIDEIRRIYTMEGLEIVFKEYAQSIELGSEREELFSFYQNLTGRNFRPYKKQEKRPKFVGPKMLPKSFLTPGISNQLKKNPTRANPVTKMSAFQAVGAEG